MFAISPTATQGSPRPFLAGNPKEYTGNPKQSGFRKESPDASGFRTPSRKRVRPRVWKSVFLHCLVQSFQTLAVPETPTLSRLLLGVPKPGCFKPGCFKSALLRSFALFAPCCTLFALFRFLLRICVTLRSFVLICALLRSFAYFCIRPRLERPRLGIADLETLSGLFRGSGPHWAGSRRL